VREPQPTIESLAASLGRVNHPACSLDLAVGECRIRLETDCEALHDRLAHYFRYFATTPEREPDFRIQARQCDAPQWELPFEDWPRESGKSGRKEEFVDLVDGRVVRKVRTGMQFLLGAEVRMAVGPCLANDNQVINFVNAQYMNWLLARGWILCHAAAVVADGRAMAFAGFSGGGKSTLALHLMSRGVAFASNDRLLIAAQGDRVMASGIPKLPRINPGTALHNPDLARILPAGRRAALAELDEGELWELEEKYDVDIAETFDDAQFHLVSPLTGFVVLSWRRDRRQAASMKRVDLAHRPDLLAALMKSPGPFFQPLGGVPPTGRQAPAEEPYVRCLAGVPVWEISGGVDFERAVGWCLDLLAGRPPSGQ
jgi:HprK-related kinase B